MSCRQNSALSIPRTQNRTEFALSANGEKPGDFLRSSFWQYWVNKRAENNTLKLCLARWDLYPLAHPFAS
jgi:hypothetical protein